MNDHMSMPEKRHRAARVVAANARDADDLTELLDMLGLSAAEGQCPQAANSLQVPAPPAPDGSGARSRHDPARRGHGVAAVTARCSVARFPLSDKDLWPAQLVRTAVGWGGWLGQAGREDPKRSQP